MKKSGGGGSLLAADSKGFAGFCPSSLRGALATWQSSRSDLPIRQKVKCWFSKTNLQFLLTYSPTNLLTSKAFTMAEILLSLTIIGVVAAITLPSLTGNVNERVWNTQRKALYARFSQAIALMPQLNGYGEYEGTNTDDVVTATKDTAAETFVSEGLSKVLKINNICDNTHLADCGIPTSYTNLAATNKTFPTKLSELNSMFISTYTNAGNGYSNPQNYIDTKAAAFETQNGESIAVYYNPNCIANLQETVQHYSQPQMCANFIYDLNGNEGPNAVGKDIGFITAIYATDTSVVAPMPLASNTSTNLSQIDANGGCTAMDSDSRLPNIDELSAIFYNKELVGIVSNVYWSSSVVDATNAWRQDFATGHHYPLDRSESRNIRCIKR